MTRILDAYGHVSLPRQFSAEQFLQVMDENSVEQAVVCTAETCPDLGELSRAAMKYGGRMRSAGLPVGDTPEARLANMQAQMDAGFIGARLGAELVAREPRILDPIGRAGGIPVMVGGDCYRACAAQLLRFLGTYPACYVWGAHFAEPSDFAVIGTDPAVKALFDHPRFAVICSRHSAFPARFIEEWAGILVKRLTWDRLLFGSEYPVAMWRNELYADTFAWMERFAPSDADREKYLQTNAWRMLFSRAAPQASLLPADLTAFCPDPRANVPLFPANTLNLPEQLHQKLTQRYLARPALSRGRYSDFLAQVLGEVAESSRA